MRFMNALRLPEGSLANGAKSTAGALLIGIINAQNELSALLPRE